MSKYIKATSYGKLYIETEDFFKQPEVIATIKKLRNSSIVKKIDEQNRKLKDEEN